MNNTPINRSIEYGVFVKYYDGYYKFLMDNGDTIIFEEIPRLAIKKFDLKSDTYKGKSFEITYSEHIDDDDDDFIIYKIEKLELA